MEEITGKNADLHEMRNKSVFCIIYLSRRREVI